MTWLVDLSADVMRFGAHAHIFCTRPQYHQWINVLSTVENFLAKEDGQSEEPEIEKYRFVVKCKSLVYVRGKRNYFEHLSKSSVYLISMTEHSLRLWRGGVDAREVLVGVYFTFAPPFLSGFATNKNFTTSVPRVGRSETAFDTAQDSSRRPRKFRPEQKPVSLLRWILRKFTNPGA